MSQYLDSLTRLRLVRAAAAVLRRDPRTARPVDLRLPELCLVPIRSAVLPLCNGFAVMAAGRQTMRSTHLDDQPQLPYVIRGQMSLVPRPQRPHSTLLKSLGRHGV
jgi:Bacterial sugar transferase